MALALHALRGQTGRQEADMATVTLEHVSKRYRDVTAVRDLSIDIADGELMVVIGPSGCGKSTLLRLIAGLELPDEGTIRIGERVVNKVAPGARNVAMVFEDYALYPHLVVRDNLGFALGIHRTPAEEIRQRVSAVAATMELDPLLERKPSELATGQAQHVAIGRAVVRDPPAVFLFDDALSHLDARQRIEARAELGRLHRELGTTIVSVTHDQSEALAVGTRVAVMDEGELQQVGPPRTLYDHPDTVFVAGFVGSPPMNLIEMTLERSGQGARLRSPAFTLPAPERAADPGAVSTPTEVTVGIRPEHIQIAPAGEREAMFRARCDLVEFLGHQTLVHLRVGDVELRAFEDPAEPIRAGFIVDCNVALERLHLFDTRTGRSLAASADGLGATQLGHSTRWLAGAAPCRESSGSICRPHTPGTVDEALNKNRELWDAWTAIHLRSEFYDVASFRNGERPIRLADYEREEVGSVEGRTLLHLQCHFGLDTLSWARLGATVTGVDFSPAATAAARELAADIGVDATFVTSDVYGLPDVLHERFDIVYTSSGVLGWLPDIARWAQVAAHFVRPGGFLYLNEIHPVAQVFENEGVEPGELRLAYPYWSHAEPLRFDVKGSYADRDASTDGLVEYGWDHSMGEIVTALADAGLRLEFLHEFDFVRWRVDFLVEGEDGRWRLPAGSKGGLPLSFSLKATKPLDAA